MKRKRLITLLMFFCILAGNAWGRGLFFNNKVVEFNYNSSAWESNCDLTMTLISSTGDSYTYQVEQDVWWEWYSGANPNNMANTPSEGYQDTGFYWSVNVSGSGITIPSDFTSSYAGNHYELKKDADHGHRIRFTLSSTQSSGSITVTVAEPDFYDDHLSYSASYTIKINQKVPSKKWDFTSQQMEIGRSTVSTDPLYSICNYNTSTDTYDGPVTKESISGFSEAGVNALFWYNTGLTTTGNNAYKFVINYGSNPSNSYEVEEAKGLQFHADAGKIGIANDEDAAASQYRYIALKVGAKVVVPSSYFSSYTHPRVRVKMGRYGGPSSSEDTGVGIRLTIRNATDAVGTTIEEATYKIGGCSWWGAKGDKNQRGEYHFNIINKATDFEIEVVDGQWLELYSIEVYDSNEIITENNLLGDTYQLLNISESGAAAAHGTYYLHYRGKGETTSIDNIHTTGTVTSPTFTATEKTTKQTYTSTPGEFGTFRIRLKCQTMSFNDKQYCTDYASRTMSVGYRETQSYPYTWDFADVHTYKFTNGYILADGRMGTEGTYYNDATLRDQRLWIEETSAGAGKDNPSLLHLSPNAGHDVDFCGGSQLWYGTTMIPEAKGLGFTPVNYDMTYNGSLVIHSGNMKFHQALRDWWGWRVTVPSVPAQGAVYVRAKNVGTDNVRHVKFWTTAEGTPVYNKTTGDIDFWNNDFSSNTNYNKIQVAGKDDEFIYAIYNNDAENAKDITLFFNGVEVQKIAVSTDKKTVNKNGWASESRERVIDPSLTSEMTGQNFSTFLVTGVDNANTHVILTEIGNNQLMPSATEGSVNGCLIHNNANTSVNIVDGGFHLFVPDMHDSTGETPLKSEISTSSSKLKAKLTSGTVSAFDGDYTNFVFTYKYYNLTDAGYITGTVHEGSQSFYRVAKNGANSSGHQAYLPLLTSDVPNSWLDADPSRSYTLVFEDDESVEPTDIESVFLDTSMMKVDNNVYYSLSGQRVNGKPTKGGLYICNGKKIIVK